MKKSTEKAKPLPPLPPKGEKEKEAGLGASLFLTSEERLSHALHFSFENLAQICELAAARRRESSLTPEARAKGYARAREMGVGFKKKGCEACVQAPQTDQG